MNHRSAEEKQGNQIVRVTNLYQDIVNLPIGFTLGQSLESTSNPISTDIALSKISHLSIVKALL